MRVLFLNTMDSGGGAARAAVRLLHGVRRADVDVQMLVQRKSSDDISVVGPEGRFGNDLSALRRHLDCAPLGLYSKRNGFIFSPAFLPEKLKSKVVSNKPDIVHLHWLGEGFLRVESMAKFELPIVWTLHDSWAFTGGCHIPFECLKYREKCGCCPALGSKFQHDLSRWVWWRKKNVFKKLNLTVVTPSRWLSRCAGSSSLLKGVPIEVIPNGIDLNVFKPHGKLIARQLLGLPQDKKLILFGAMSSTSDKNKGYHFLQPALNKLVANCFDINIEIVVFGSSEPIKAPDFGMVTHYLGKMYDDASISLLFSAVDLFVAPSIQENLSNTVMEAMACGTPCVAFDVGGMSDLIEHEQNGYLATPFDTEDLAMGISWVLADEDQWHMLSSRCREKVTEFSIASITERYLSLYSSILTK